MPNLDSYIASIYFKIRNGFSSLKNSPRELYIAFWLKFLDSYSYFSLSIIFTLFLSSDFGFSDVEAGTVYGAWGAMTTIMGLLTGVIVDNLGVAKSLRVGFLISLLARIGIFWTTSKKVLLFHALVSQCIALQFSRDYFHFRPIFLSLPNSFLGFFFSF